MNIALVPNEPPSETSTTQYLLMVVTVRYEPVRLWYV